MAEKHSRLFKTLKNTFTSASKEGSPAETPEAAQTAEPAAQAAETAAQAAGTATQAAGTATQAAGTAAQAAGTAAQAAPDTGEGILRREKRIFAYTSDPLQSLYNQWLMETDADGVLEDISEYMAKNPYRIENDTAYNYDVNIKRFLMQARIFAKKRQNEQSRAAVGGSEERANYSAAAEPLFYITPDSMMVLTLVLPPIGQGEHIHMRQFEEYIRTAGIHSGVLTKILTRLVLEKGYFRIYPLALGTLPVQGKDGEIIERIPREKQVTYNENELGNIDFTSRQFFREISKDDVICDIVAPSNGTDGKDIRGRAVYAKNGRKAYVPRGKNTVISEDGTSLLASADGHIVFKGGVFEVVEILHIPGTVDFSVGNLNYHGDIVIRGDVLNGFEIHADGDVLIYGVVEAAHIFSGGNITLYSGMNGNFEGELNAKGEIHSPFLENTLVSAGGDIHTGSLICCDVFCDGTIYANSKMGIVIGGSLTAMHSIKARIIGNKAGRKTELVLGTLPHALREKDGLEKHAKDIDNTLSVLEKNIAYLKGINNLPTQKLMVLRQLEEQYELYRNQKESIEHRQESIENQLDLVDEATIECKTIYPITLITISGVTRKITDVTKNAKIALSEQGEIEIYPLSGR